MFEYSLYYCLILKYLFVLFYFFVKVQDLLKNIFKMEHFYKNSILFHK